MREASADELRPMMAAQLLAAAAPPVRPWKPCSSTPTPSPPMAASTADDLADLLATVLAYRPQPRAWPRPRPPWLPHPRRRLPRLRGVVRISR
jgi:hypothetical protein